MPKSRHQQPMCKDETYGRQDCLNMNSNRTSLELKTSWTSAVTVPISGSGSRRRNATTRHCVHSSIGKREVLLNLPGKRERVSIFFSIYPPAISCSKYVARIHKYTEISRGVFMHAIYLLHILRTIDRRFELSGYNLHRLLMTAVVLSIKFHEHAWYSNKYYTQVGGIPSTGELNKMELIMLQLLDYKLLVQPETLDRFFFFCDNDENEGNKLMLFLKKNARELCVGDRCSDSDSDGNCEDETRT